MLYCLVILAHDLMVLLLTQALDNGLGNSVCTVYEIHAGEDSTEEGMCMCVCYCSVHMNIHDIVHTKYLYVSRF